MFHNNTTSVPAVTKNSLGGLHEPNNYNIFYTIYILNILFHNRYTLEKNKYTDKWNLSSNRNIL